MAIKSNVAEAVVPERAESLKPLYLEAVSRVERLHRRLLDLIKDEFDRMGWDDINPVQALLMFNIGDAETRADRRSVRIRLTPKGEEVAEVIDELYERHLKSIDKVGGLDGSTFENLNKALGRLERFWVDQILYKLRPCSGRTSEPAWDRSDRAQGNETPCGPRVTMVQQTPALGPAFLICAAKSDRH